MPTQYNLIKGDHHIDKSLWDLADIVGDEDACLQILPFQGFWLGLVLLTVLDVEEWDDFAVDTQNLSVEGDFRNLLDEGSNAVPGEGRY